MYEKMDKNGKIACIEMWPWMHFLDLQQMDHWLNSCMLSINHYCCDAHLRSTLLLVDANDVHSVWPKVGKAASWSDVDHNRSPAEMGHHEGWLVSY